MKHSKDRAQYGSKQINFRFRRTDEVGSVAAENDKLLDSAFVDAGFLEVLRDTENPRAVVVGRTGAGKSALLLQLERKAERVERIDPLSIAIEYVQHTEIPALATARVNFEPFFRFLWKHIITLEVLRSWHAAKTETSWGEFRLFIERKIGGGQINEVMNHFERWCGKEWTEARGQTKEMIRKFNGEISATLPFVHLSLKGGTEKVSGGDRHTGSFTPEQINSVQRLVQELTNERVKTVFGFLQSKVLVDPYKPHYVVIDHLDGAWVDSAFAYDMIEALIDVVGQFSELDNVKVVVALREDIVAVLRNREGRSQQWEKYEGLFLRLRWSPHDLTDLIDRRLRLMLKDKFGGTISLANLLPATAKRGKTPVTYLIERTLMRPRDMIEFVNTCLRITAEQGKQTVGWQQIEVAELAYSRGRLEALTNEWSSIYPGLRVVLEAFHGLRGSTSIKQLAESDRLAEVLNYGERASVHSPQSPVPLPLVVFEMLSATYIEIWTLIVTVLYTIGFLGAKSSAQEPFLFRADESAVGDAISADTPLQVHPMFTRALGIDAYPFSEGN